ncbi:putative phage uncharacterized protein [Magnetospirillum sp. XM-1]|uniref:phage terminase large subunit n=1 Tax=Magnetospirillum sp. XM-1 TaxID=1663591 RepID=UPI00073E05A7|nr:phage terminase large subunit [Magnetospirillum sp. XM-1]CUW38794.1 putative phage uncharacterized protein [Magnetospirillum sp. XM-1]
MATKPLSVRKSLSAAEAELRRELEAARGTDRLLAACKARDDLIDFVRLMMPDPNDVDDPHRSRYTPAKHHRALAAALEAVERGDITRLIINMPPRHGKTELARKFVAWFLGRDAYRSVIYATYNDDFAMDHGRSIRETIKLPAYRQAFPTVDVVKGSSASDRFETTERGMAVFKGVGGSLTGRGADLLIIDDPIKDREDADSPRQRQKLYDWYQDVARTRLMTAGARVVIIQTRWHEDDLVGRLIDPKNPFYNSRSAARWRILDLPALAYDEDPLGRAPGEALWPERFSREFLENIREDNPRGFAALYQGKPAPDDGDFFRRDWIKTYGPDQLPKNLRIYAASDHAVSTAQDRDATCLLLAGVDENNNVYILPDTWWRRAQTDVVVEAMLTLMEVHRPLIWWAEKGHISKSIGPFLRKRMQEKHVFVAIDEQTPVKDKQTRAQSIQGRMAMGKVFFPAFAPWYMDAVDQMMKFPNATHDDFVDALAHLGLGLQRQVAAKPNYPFAGQEGGRPKSGTLAWVKWSADKARKAAANSHGGF